MKIFNNEILLSLKIKVANTETKVELYIKFQIKNICCLGKKKLKVSPKKKKKNENRKFEKIIWFYKSEYLLDNFPVRCAFFDMLTEFKFNEVLPTLIYMTNTRAWEGCL